MKVHLQITEGHMASVNSGPVRDSVMVRSTPYLAKLPLNLAPISQSLEWPKSKNMC